MIGFLKQILIFLHLNLIGFWKSCQEQIWDRHKSLPAGKFSPLFFSHYVCNYNITIPIVHTSHSVHLSESPDSGVLWQPQQPTVSKMWIS